MPNKPAYLDFLAEWLSPLGAITARAMFGGHCLYCDGVVFALVAENILYLKVNDDTRPRFERLGLKPFRPFEDKIQAQGLKYPAVMQYYPPPAEFFEREHQLSQHAGINAHVVLDSRARGFPRWMSEVVPRQAAVRGEMPGAINDLRTRAESLERRAGDVDDLVEHRLPGERGPEHRGLAGEDEPAFLHQLVRSEDGTELTRIVSRWRPVGKP